LGGPGGDSAAVAARVRDSARRAEIVAALDDWASISADPARRAWLLAVARAADPLGLHFHNWLEARVLRREAEALIPLKSPTVQPGSK